MDGTKEAIVLEYSINNRNDGSQIGPNVLAIGFGGHKVSGLLERTADTRAIKVKQVTVLIGIKDYLLVDFDIKGSITAYEHLIHTHVLTNSYHRQYQSLIFYRLVSLEKRAMFVS